MGVSFISLNCKFGLKLVLQIILLWAPRKKNFKTKWLQTSEAYEKKNPEIWRGQSMLWGS